MARHTSDTSRDDHFPYFKCLVGNETSRKELFGENTNSFFPYNERTHVAVPQHLPGDSVEKHDEAATKFADLLMTSKE